VWTVCRDCEAVAQVLEPRSSRRPAPARGEPCSSILPAPSEFGTSPAGGTVQIHGTDADPFFVDEGDVDAARELVASTEDAPRKPGQASFTVAYQTRSATATMSSLTREKRRYSSRRPITSRRSSTVIRVDIPLR